MPRLVGLLRRMRARGSLPCARDAIELIRLPVGVVDRGIGRQLNGLRHGWRCAGDERQHKSRMSESFHRITFIRE